MVWICVLIFMVRIIVEDFLYFYEIIYVFILCFWIIVRNIVICCEEIVHFDIDLVFVMFLCIFVGKMSDGDRGWGLLLFSLRFD